MKTHLTIKLQNIINVAHSYSKSLRQEYWKEQDPRRATLLCELWNALDNRIRWVQQTVFIEEFGKSRWESVTGKEITTLPNVYSQKINDAVYKIMALARKQVEHNLPNLFNAQSLAL